MYSVYAKSLMKCFAHSHPLIHIWSFFSISFEWDNCENVYALMKMLQMTMGFSRAESIWFVFGS